MERTYPIFVPLTEIDLQADTFNTNDRDGLITLTPKNGVLHGFRCTKYDEWKAEFEHCGPREPMQWMIRMWCCARYRNGYRAIAAKYPKDYIDYMKPMPIDCIALAPQESGGYRVVGSGNSRIQFVSGRATHLEDTDDIVGFEFSNYVPMPFLDCDVQVEVEDITEKELIERLDNLIRK